MPCRPKSTAIDAGHNSGRVAAEKNREDAKDSRELEAEGGWQIFPESIPRHIGGPRDDDAPLYCHDGLSQGAPAAGSEMTACNGC